MGNSTQSLAARALIAPNLSSSERLVLTYLATFAEDGVLREPREVTSERLGVGRSTVARALSSLERKGFIAHYITPPNEPLPPADQDQPGAGFSKASYHRCFVSDALLTHAEVRVLSILWAHSDSKGEGIHLSREQITSRSTASPRTVDSSLTKLVREGYLLVTQGRGGRGVVTTYSLARPGHWDSDGRV